MEKYFAGVGPKVLFTALKSWTEEEEICDKRKEWSDVRSLLRRSNQTLRDSDKLSSSSQRPNWFLLWSCDVLDSLAAERLIKLVQERGAALSQSSSVYSHSQSRLNFRTKSLVSPSFSNGSHSWTSGVSQSSAVVSVFYPAAATKTSADTSRNSAVQLFSPYFNFLMWLWLLWLLLKHPNHELRKKQELNYQTGKQKEARQRSVDVARRTWDPDDKSRSSNAEWKKTRRRFVCLSLMGRFEATAAAARPAPGEGNTY